MQFCTGGTQTTHPQVKMLKATADVTPHKDTTFMKCNSGC